MRDEDRIVYLGPDREAFGGPLTEPGGYDPLDESRFVSSIMILAIRDRATSMHFARRSHVEVGFLQSGVWYEFIPWDVAFWDEFVWAIERNANLLRPEGRDVDPQSPSVGWLELRISGVDRVYTVGVLQTTSKLCLEFWPCEDELTAPSPWDKPVSISRSE